MKKNRLHTLALSVLFMTATAASAQQLNTNDIMYHSFRSPMANQLNPALFPEDSKWFVTFPRVDISMALPISYNELGLHYDPNTDMSTLNINDLLNTLDANGSSLLAGVNVDILRIGFTVAKRLHFTLDAGLRVSSSIALPTEITRLVTEGNMDANGNPQELSLGCDRSTMAQAYAYTSLGGSFDFPTIPLTVGARFNLLHGAAFLSIDNIDIDINSSIESNSMSLTTDYQARSAGLFSLVLDENGNPTLDYTLGFPQSRGFTFDLGAKYTLNKFEFSASLLNVGPGINWVENPNIIRPKNPGQSITFDGIELSALLNNGSADTAALNRMLDSLLDNISPQNSEETFWYTVPTSAYVGANYTLGEYFRVGYLFHGEWSHGWHKGTSFYCNNTLSLTTSLFHHLDLTVANSFSAGAGGFDALNPGVALSLNIAKRIQFYISADYISSLYVADIKGFRLFFGLNIVGYSKKSE